MAPGPKKRIQARGLRDRSAAGGSVMCDPSRAASLTGRPPPVGGFRFRMSPAPAPHDGVDHSRVKQRTSMAYREQGPHAVKPGCYIKEHR